MATLRTCFVPQQNAISGNSAVALSSLPRGNSCVICDSRVRINSSERWSVRRKASHSPNRASLGRNFWRAKAGEEDIDVAQENVNSGELKSGTPKGFGTPKTLVTDKTRSSSKSASSSSGSIRRTPPLKPLITTQEADQQMLKTESAVVTTLGILFLVIIVQGIVLAASGFLPEEYDQVVSKWLYPAFSPTVGTFFAFAAGYGVWKFYRGGTGAGGS